MIGGRQENSWSPSIWARHFGRSPYWAIGVAEQHITVMAPSGIVNIHVAEREKLHFDTGSVWVRMSAPELGVIRPLTGLAKRAAAEFNAAVAREFGEYESTLDLQPFVEALVRWWSSFQEATRDAWAKRRWLTEEFIVDWDRSLGHAVSGTALSTSQRRVLAARVSGVEAEALNAAFGDWNVRSHAAGQNNALVNLELIDERSFFDKIEKSPLMSTSGTTSERTSNLGDVSTARLFRMAMTTAWPRQQQRIRGRSPAASATSRLSIQTLRL